MNARVVVFLLCALTVLLPASNLRAQDAYAQFYDSVSVSGRVLAYRDIGQGPPLVMLHGFYQTSANWEPLFEEFSKSYRLIVVDLPGHGRSSYPLGAYTHREVAQTVYALMDSLGIQDFKGVGFSSGAMTLLHMATARHDRLTAMVLIGATTYFPEQARVIMRAASPDSVTEARMANLTARHPRGREQAIWLLNQFVGFSTSYEDMNFTPPLLSTVTARTLIVHGDRDQFFPVSIPVDLYTSIPQAALWIVPNFTHLALPANEPGRQRYKEVLLGFLAQPN